jgi:hypothetical protein
MWLKGFKLIILKNIINLNKITMQTLYVFTQEEREQFLKEFCEVNDFSYKMVCKVMYDNLLGEDDAKDFERVFRYYLSGKFGINHGCIRFK